MPRIFSLRFRWRGFISATTLPLYLFNNISHPRCGPRHGSDMTMACFEGPHWIMVAWALLILTGVTVGLPVGLLIAVRRLQRRSRRDAATWAAMDSLGHTSTATSDEPSIKPASAVDDVVDEQQEEVEEGGGGGGGGGGSVDVMVLEDVSSSSSSSSSSTEAGSGARVLQHSVSWKLPASYCSSELSEGTGSVSSDDDPFNDDDGDDGDDDENGEKGVNDDPRFHALGVVFGRLERHAWWLLPAWLAASGLAVVAIELAMGWALVQLVIAVGVSLGLLGVIATVRPLSGGLQNTILALPPVLTCLGAITVGVAHALPAGDAQTWMAAMFLVAVVVAAAVSHGLYFFVIRPSQARSLRERDATPIEAIGLIIDSHPHRPPRVKPSTRAIRGRRKRRRVLARANTGRLRTIGAMRAGVGSGSGDMVIHATRDWDDGLSDVADEALSMVEVVVSPSVVGSSKDWPSDESSSAGPMVFSYKNIRELNRHRVGVGRRRPRRSSLGSTRPQRRRSLSLGRPPKEGQ